MLLDSGHQESTEQDAAPTPPRPTENQGATTPWRLREPDTDLPRQQQQHQHGSDHGRGFQAVEGANAARGRADYPVRGWGISSRSPDRGRADSNAVSTDGERRDFQVSRAPLSRTASLAPDSRPDQEQTRRSPPPSPLSRAGGAEEVTTATTPLHRSTGNSEAPITKIAVLNALLLGGGPSDGPAAPGSFSRARTAAGGTHPRRRRCGEGPKGGEGGAWGRRQDDITGPLPSIARLVEAGALLSGAGEGDWQ